MDQESTATPPDDVFNLKRLCRYFSELSPQPMLAVEGAAFIVRHVNDAFLSMAGAQRDDVLGHPFAEAVPEGEANGCMALLDRVYRTGKPEFLAEQKHGNATAARWSYAVWAILGNDDRPAGVMIQVTDSTETANFREQAAMMNESLLLNSILQQQLTEAAEMLNRRLQDVVDGKEYFIAVLSHELRTPLTPVLLAASMLQEDPGLDPETRATMRMIHRNVRNEARLIDDLLDMTRMEHGKLLMDRRRVDLRSVLEQALAACRAELEAAGLTADLETGAGLPIVEADAARLQQVFSNLLRNSIKFTPPGGSIRVRSSCDGDSCVVEVIDNGAGIAPEFLPRVFSAFEQGDKAQSRSGGLGLGLAICKMVVSQHGGDITAHSDGKGKGAKFVVRLPALVERPAIAAAPGSGEPDRPRPGKPLRILLVEDHADTAGIIRRLLKADGHTVHWVASVGEALKIAAAYEFDLLLSDLGLPDGTGVELMGSLRQRGSAFPGIVLSGYGQDQDITRTREAGFAAHLIKPLNAQTLREAIVRAMTKG